MNTVEKDNTVGDTFVREKAHLKKNLNFMKKYKYEKYDYSIIGIKKILSATWSLDLARDIDAFHNIDAEKELTAILSEHIAAEIDRRILASLSTNLASFDSHYIHGKI
jgi:ASC-1-like (ASCH) protein